MLKTDAKKTAVKAEQLPQYLASLGLNPYQITAVVYGLFKQIKLQGTLTPSEDNAIHLDKESIMAMAKNQLLVSSLYSLFLKVQRSKNWDVLFKKEAKNDALTAPDLRHNPSGAESNLPQAVEDEETIEILDFMKFVESCGIDPELIKKAMEEKMLLGGAK